MRVLIIHGIKLTRKGSLARRYKNRLIKGLELAALSGFDRIVISGGRTRRRFPSEAEAGLDFLREKMKDGGGRLIDIENIILEERSVSTVQNILFTKEALGHILPSKTVGTSEVTGSGTIGTTKAAQPDWGDIREIKVIVQGDAAIRAAYLYRKLWPEIKGRAKIVTAPGSTFVGWIYESLSYLYARLPFSDSFVLTRVAQRIMRNRD